MQKISSIPNSDADPNGEFTNADPTLLIPATKLDAAWLNTLQREAIAVVESAGLTLDPNDDTQLLQAIQVLALPTPPDLTSINTNIALNAFRIAVNGSLSVLKMQDGVVDRYLDELGVNLGASVNQIYDGVAGSYGNHVNASNPIPIMTSNTAPSGVVSSSSANSPGSEFYGLLATGDMMFAVNQLTGWFQYQLAVAQIIGEYSILSAPVLTRNPAAWTYEGSNDGIAWTVLDTQTAQTFATVATTNVYSIANTIPYLYYRLNITAVNGDPNWLQFGQLLMQTQAITADMILVSNAVTAVTQPSTANVILSEGDIDAVTLNTDLVATVSRDGNTTKTAVMLIDQGLSAIGRRILQGTVDISTQPAGTSMVLEITTANGKSLGLYGSSLGWKA